MKFSLQCPAAPPPLTPRWGPALWRGEDLGSCPTALDDWVRGGTCRDQSALRAPSGEDESEREK